ncbi:DUF3085 domain-containing protein [Hyphomicrobium sp. CS1BSMeth3]|uniref:DUF3085 domain-containing protein n=1 Tax=Hyphomicrobium sp. CS1BSMeth3 TaxID=1892844 RepID=UPI0009316D16|nr:DUF3085 domain-containing protein [Hyphomicrobium sp. CS1BSMeth3]
MPTLSFPRASIARLAKLAAQLNAQHLALVGDDGIYFMLPEQPAPYTIVHARECNPADCFDWYDIKRETFGGDDGVEHIPLAEINNWLNQTPKRVPLEMELTPQTYHLLNCDTTDPT